ncbi:YqaJ viral recombinase family protein, partial [Streptomyces sp. DH37]|uniref:YqaJ viral recombinase family protein n=1 Tax=Streptomyces sp. DH37 TaxID=3040122 RepID=UPI0024416D82
DVESEAAECGRVLEDDIARLFARRTGFEIAPSPGTLAHVDYPLMRVNIDRLVLEPAEAGGTVVVPLECKNRSEYIASEWDAGVPDEPALQGLWAMAVGGWPHAWVAPLIGGNRLRWHRLERDQELI